MGTACGGLWRRLRQKMGGEGEDEDEDEGEGEGEGQEVIESWREEGVGECEFTEAWVAEDAERSGNATNLVSVRERKEIEHVLRTH